MNTSGHVYDDFVRLFFLYEHREVSIWTREFPEESDQFRFLRDVRLVNLKGSVGLILTKTSEMRVTIPMNPIDLSTRSFIPLPHFFNSRRTTPFPRRSPFLVLFPPKPKQSI